MAEKRKHLEEIGLHVVSMQDENGQVDLKRLMELLGKGEIQGVDAVDSILLEGGGTLNDSALQAGIVQEVKVFLAPKIFGGNGRTPVAGQGVAMPSEAAELQLENVSRIGEDILLEYKLKKGYEKCLQG